MKTIKLYGVLIIALMSLYSMVACGGDDELDNGKPAKENKDNTQNEKKKYSVEGVWEDGVYFISLNSEKFLTAYVAPRFIDCGNYSVSQDNIITCTNTYFSKKTVYTIKSITDTTMEVVVDYTDIKGNAETTTLKLTKSSKDVAFKDNSLISKSDSWYTMSFGTVTITFDTYNTGTKSSTQENCKKYPIPFYYIFFNNVVYYQQFRPTTSVQVPTIGGWTDDIGTGKIRALKVSIYPDGRISTIGADDEYLY